MEKRQFAAALFLFGLVLSTLSTWYAEGAMLPSKIGDLHVAIGHGQAQIPSLKEDVKFKVDGQTQVSLFGKAQDGDFFGLDFEVSGGALSASFNEGAVGTFNTTFIRTSVLGRLSILPGTYFSASLFAGGGAAWHVERRCFGATRQDPCPFDEKTPNILPNLQGGVELRFEDNYGIRISAEYLAIPIWTDVFGPSLSGSASFLWNLTHDM